MAADRLLIVVLPGIGGSVLARAGDEAGVVWDAGKGDITDLVVRPARMSVAEWPVLKPVGLTRSTKLLGFTIVPGYEQLLKTLEGFGVVDWRGDPRHPVPGADVVAVPYDFRRSIVEAAERLDAVVRAHLGDLGEQELAGRVLVLAHSLGGLVARFWLGPMQRWPWCRALITMGTPHRGASKALDWLVNGVRLRGVPLAGPSELLWDWPSVAQLLPRYPAIRDTTGSNGAWYPHELPLPDVAAAAGSAYQLHCDIEAAWAQMPRRGPEMVPCLGWSHPTLDAAYWNGVSLTVTKKTPDWLDLTGWEKDLGDGTVPAVSAVPIEASHHISSPIRLRDRHVPLAGTPKIAELVAQYLGRRPVDSIRGDEDVDHPPAIGLDLEELYPVGQPIPLTVTLREVPVDVAGQAVWATVTPAEDGVGSSADVRLVWDGPGGCFRGELPGQAPGLYQVQVSAREVPAAGDLAAGDTIAVLEDG